MLSHMPGAAKSRMGFVIAGGRSSRMGEDKAFLEFGHVTLLERALAAVRAVSESVAIVGEPAKFEKYGVTVPDIFPGCGPLAGIHAALLHSTADSNLMLAVDMPFVSRELLAFLFEVAENGDAVVTVPRVRNRTQPLCAVYRRDFAGVAEQALRAGKYKVDAAFSRSTVRVIEENELAAAGFAEKCFFNVNTPQDRVDAAGQLP